MEYIGIPVVVICCIAVFFVRGVYENRRDFVRLRKKLKNSFGRLPDKDWKPECYDNLEQYHIKHREQDGCFEIDDITWNDLEMNDVYGRMDYTMSRAGAEYLYHMLRTEQLDEKAFERMEEQICFFMTHEEERISMQLLLKRLGRMEKYSLYQYLEQLSMLEKRSNLLHYVLDTTLLFSIVLLFYNVGLGMPAVTLMGIINIGLYLKEKSEIEPYLTSFAYVLNLLHISGRIGRENIAVIEKEKKTLLACRAKLRRFARGASVVMGNSSGNPFEIILDYIRMLFHIDLIRFNRMYREVMKNEAEIDIMFGLWGYLDAVISIGLFRASLPAYCTPEFTREELFAMEEGCHPLLAHAVANSVRTHQSILLTGSNASGKSTFLKTVALNALLSQTVHTAVAARFAMRPARIYSSMALRDNMQGGESYYIVEIKAIKRILDAVERCKERPEEAGVLCFVDEVLRGTNTVERIASSTQVLGSLTGRNVCCFAATHDIELTSLLEGVYENYHFEEEIADNDVLFSYQLKEGRATTRNAIRLLRVMGYSDAIVGEAERMAQRFLTEGGWSMQQKDE